VTKTHSLLEHTITRDGERLALALGGSAETEALASLHQILSGLHEEALRTAMKAVVVDLRGLEFASSSCLKAFVTWLQRVQELEDANRYAVVFRSEPKHAWQRRSLGALAAFAAGVVQIEAEAS
jgi:hypothetical protein